jgi:hypothetical protein
MRFFHRYAAVAALAVCAALPAPNPVDRNQLQLGDQMRTLQSKQQQQDDLRQLARTNLTAPEQKNQPALDLLSRVLKALSWQVTSL